MATVSTASGMTLSPTSVMTATNENYVSALTATGGDLHKRDVSEKLVKRYGDQGITGLLELMGAKAPCTQTTFEHYEETFRHNDVTVQFDNTAQIAAGETQTTTMTVQAASIHDSKNALRVGDILLFEDGTLLYVQTITSTHVFEVFPVTSSGWVTSHTQTTDYIASVIGNAFPEGSAQPEGLTPRIHEYSNKVMIMKETFEVTGTEATNVVYVKVNSPEFGSGYLWYLKGEADTYKRFMDYSEIMMIMGETISNTNLATSSLAVELDGNSTDYTLDTLRGTEGLIPFISNNGQSMDLGSASITMSDFDAIVKSLDKHRGALEYALYAGINLSLDIDDLLASQGAYAAGGANYGTFQYNKNMALNLGFNSFT